MALASHGYGDVAKYVRGRTLLRQLISSAVPISSLEMRFRWMNSAYGQISTG